MKINNKFTSLAAGAVLLAGTTTAAVVSTTKPAEAAWLNSTVCTPNLVTCWYETVQTFSPGPISCAANLGWPVFIKTNWSNSYTYSHCNF